MPDEIADSSASMAVENAESVIKAGLNKRKLEETEAELENGKQKKSKKESLVATGVKSKPRRFRITLTKSAEFSREGFSIFSKPMNVGIFQWKLLVLNEKPAGFLGLFLHLCPPQHFKGHFEFVVNMTFRVLNVFPEKDIARQWPNKFNDKNKGWGFGKMIRMEDLLDPINEFLHDDGTIRVEVDFTVVQIAAPDHLQPVDKENGNKKSD